MNLIVIAKAPRAGAVKTRLCPPCTPEEAAVLAEAALIDTIAAARGTTARVVLALDGAPGSWFPQGVRVISQRGNGLDERLAAAFEDVGGPALLIGMDTPQVTSALLDASMRRLRRRGTDAVLGRAADGGWWAIGLRRPDPRAFLGIPMSRETTHEHQRDRLELLGLAVHDLPELRDVDTFADAEAVAGEVPGSVFAERIAAVAAGWIPA